jgi:hypothetical protein
VATLYVRNVPPELYEAVKRWADDSGRSVNAEILDVLEQESVRRNDRSDWFNEFLEMRKEIALTQEESDFLVAAIRAGRDAR